MEGCSGSWKWCYIQYLETQSAPTQWHLDFIPQCIEWLQWHRVFTVPFYNYIMFCVFFQAWGRSEEKPPKFEHLRFSYHIILHCFFFFAYVCYLFTVYLMHHNVVLYHSIVSSSCMYYMPVFITCLGLGSYHSWQFWTWSTRCIYICLIKPYPRLSGHAGQISWLHN